MASLRILRKVFSSAAVPAAMRSLRQQQRTLHSGVRFGVQIPSSHGIVNGTPWVQITRVAFASKVEENLIQVLDSEIQCALESDPPSEDPVPQETIPFTIEDKPGEESITLRRKYGNEDIKVEVMPMDIGEDEEGEEDEGDDDTETGGQPSVGLNVTVSKDQSIVLEFNCFAYPDEIKIDTLSVKDTKADSERIAYEGPAFSDLDENLQQSFQKYLEVRGIKASLSNFLVEYMVNKDSREYITWLKNVKEFVEK